MAKLHEVEIHRLRPTQITVGLIEVHDKRDMLLGLKKDERQAFLQAHPMPAVWGPDDKPTRPSWGSALRDAAKRAEEG